MLTYHVENLTLTNTSINTHCLRLVAFLLVPVGLSDYVAGIRALSVVYWLVDMVSVPCGNFYL